MFDSIKANISFIKTILFLSSRVSRPYTTSTRDSLKKNKKIIPNGSDIELNETEGIINLRPAMVPLLILTSSLLNNLNATKTAFLPYHEQRRINHDGYKSDGDK